jgi:hypothetical protein
MALNRGIILLFAMVLGSMVGGVSAASMVSGVSQSSNSILLEKNTGIEAIAINTQSSSGALQQKTLSPKETLSCAGIKMKKPPESGSFLIFISGFISMIGIGWVKKKNG